MLHNELIIPVLANIIITFYKEIIIKGSKVCSGEKPITWQVNDTMQEMYFIYMELGGWEEIFMI